MRWVRRSERNEERHEPAPDWHEGAHWVAGAGAVVHAQRAGDLVATEPAASQAA